MSMQSSQAPPVMVAGITNFETNVSVETFPLQYTKSRFAFHGIRDRIGGVGYNLARALVELGTPVEFASVIGQDVLGNAILAELSTIPGLGVRGVLRTQKATPRSVVLVEPEGRAGIITDLKDSQELVYPMKDFLGLLKNTSVFHSTNINWSYLLAQKARENRVTVSTDVQAISTLQDDYNRRFLSVARWVFLSGENLTDEPSAVIQQIFQLFPAELVFCTLGEKGALLGERKGIEEPLIRHQPAPPLPGTPQNVTGAGDALAAGTLAALHRGENPWDALLQGQIVSGYRITQPNNSHGIPTKQWVQEQFKQT